MVNIHTLSYDEFKQYPLVVEGESKEIRYVGDGKVVIFFKPTIYSFTHNRCGIVHGSNLLRIEASKILVDVLKKNNIKHSYIDIGKEFVLSELLLEHPNEYYNKIPFRPNDVIGSDIKQLQYAPPIEVVIKRVHSGTSKHRYFSMSGRYVRPSHPLFQNFVLHDDEPYPVPIIRFDWRNPLNNPTTGQQCADEVLGDSFADLFINVDEARKTALKVYDVLSDYLNKKDIVIYDLCLFISERGDMVFGELSQDCGRYRHYNFGSLDKDVWRQGGSSETVLEKWKLFNTLIHSEE